MVPSTVRRIRTSGARITQNKAQMGPVGFQEMVVIFVIALLIFGPKKLPELGRTLGKAMTEFRRASSELRSTFDREMKNLEQEIEPVKQAASEYHYDTYN